MERIHAARNIALFGAALIIVILVGCQPKVKPTPPPVVKPPPVEVITEIMGQSVGGVPIAALVLGRGREGGVLVLAGLRGDEPGGCILARELAERLKTAEDFPENREIVIIPEVNPDAIANRSRFNSRGKDINRDFNAGSPQPETRAVIQAINDYDPKFIISIRQLDAPGIDYDGPGADGIARDLAASSPLAIHKWGASRGSIGYFAGLQKHIPVITLGLDRAFDVSRAWERYGKLLIAAVNHPVIEEIPLPPSVPGRKTPPARVKTDRSAPSRVAADQKTAGHEGKKPSSASPAPSSKPSRREILPSAAPETNLYRNALEHFEAGDYPAARKAFESHQRHKACEECPSYISKCDQAAAAMAAGKDDLKNGRYADALSEFNIVLERNPQDKNAAEYLYTIHHRLAEEHFNKGDSNAARENYSAALTYNPKCPDCSARMEQCSQADDILKKGRSYFDRGDDSGAIAEFEAVLAISPDMPELREHLFDAYFRRGKTVFGEGGYSEAGSDFEAALHHNPGCRECSDLIARCAEMDQWRNEGVEYFDRGDYANSIKSLTSAIAHNPRDPVLREYLYKSHFQLGKNLSEKKETLLDSVRHFEAALKYKDMCQNCEGAIRDRITEVQEEFNAYHYERGKSLFLEGRKDSMEKAVHEWEMVDPGYKDVKKLQETARRLLENTAP